MTSAYSPDQVLEYLDFIQVPKQWHPSAKPALTLEYLRILHIHQISTIAYENLSLHYSKDKRINLDPQFLFNKFLHRTRGGYCMETSIFYNHILRALGFQVYTAGVRIRLRDEGRPYGKYIGW
jgi:arylamine N-acetyltransferase